jgi:hypothetical protein
MMLWNNSLSTSARLFNNMFSSVLAFDPAPALFNGAGTDFNTQIIRIGTPTTQGFIPTARVMHELGHAANKALDSSLVVGPLNNTGIYCWSATVGNCTHTYEQPLWKYGSFLEGWANFIATTGIYGPTANQPHICAISASSAGGGACPTQTTTACSNSGFSCDVEWSTGFGGCPANAERFEINVARYLWDVFDSNADNANTIACNGFAGLHSDAVNFGIVGIIDDLANYAAGIGDHQKNEQYQDAALTTYDDRDGRADRDFNWNATNRGPTFGNTSNVLCINCNSP